MTGDFSDFVGSGAYSKVYRGDLFGTTVAVKKLNGGKLEAFEHELKVLSRFRHPHIVLLMGYCLEEKCIVSEFLEGGSLKEKLVKQKMGG